ncbi:MAG TPA: Gx transporter family protein, partial [Deltaproteobacteria bacterium]|nr:Gx transporter family protein [Deltaproteobacteria bacterium]
MHRNSRITTIALFIAIAVALHWIESFIPRPAPFLRFGLANIITLTALYAFGGLWALFVVISRVIIGSALTGSIFTPTFFFSLSGGIAAGIIMWHMPKKAFSAIGVSVGGAVGHMACQLFLAGIMIRQLSLIHVLPFFV